MPLILKWVSMTSTGRWYVCYEGKIKMCFTIQIINPYGYYPKIILYGGALIKKKKWTQYCLSPYNPPEKWSS